jgi:signal recognition particle subunit SRP19
MVSRAAKLCAIPVLNEERDAHHPAQWYRAGGRVRVEFTGSKENLLKMVAGKIGGR